MIVSKVGLLVLDLKLAWLAITVLAAITGQALGQSASKEIQSRFRIVGYLPDYRVATFDQAAVSYLTDVVIFSAEVHSNGTLDLDRLKNTPWGDLQKLKRKHGTRLILCVGGWERSDGFAAVADDARLRQAFIKSALAICAKHQLDGIDLDWEHPKTSEEQTGYGTLLQELRTALEPKGLKLSITMAAWQTVPQMAFDSVDWIQIMAYDHPSKHSTLENAKADVDRLIQSGAPVQKLTLGIPFYGRKIADGAISKTYKELSESGALSPETDEIDGFYFNGRDTVQAKTKFAIETSLSGVMVWEIGQDAQGEKSLLKAIHGARRAAGAQR